MSDFRSYFKFLTFFLMLNSITAADPYDEPYATGWELYIDNDLFSGQAKDRDYTGGFAFSLSGARVSNYWFSLEGFRDQLDSLTGFEYLYKGENYFQRHIIEFGLTLFTAWGGIILSRAF